MTGTLPQRVKALRARLSRLDEMGANAAETGLLDDLRSELSAPISKLKGHLVQRATLSAAGITVELPPSLDVGRKRAATLLEKFIAEKKAATLKKGRNWSQLLADVDDASTEVAKAVSSAWRSYRQEAFGGESPPVIKARLAMTSENMAAIKRYEALHPSFRAAFEALPQDVVTVERARRLANDLTETAKSFDFDVPREVKAFLEAIQVGGAPLALLTEIVQTWLKANNAFDSYRIRASDR
jgi:hypothetical protein